MDKTNIKNNTESATEETPEDKEERSTLSKSGAFVLVLVGISIIIAVILLSIRMWKYWIGKLEQVGEGTFFGDHATFFITLLVIVNIVGLRYCTFYVRITKL